jgi:hypothetical protein
MEKLLRTKAEHTWLLLFVLFTNSCSSGSGIESLSKSKSKSEVTSRSISSVNKLVSNVSTIFSENCASCHKPGEKGGELTDIMDLESLIDQEFVVPSSRKSPLLTLMKSGKMPPSGSIDNAKIALVEKWIMEGAVTSVGDKKSSREFVREADVFRLAAEDLLGAVDKEDREYMRYFSSVHLYNSGASDELLATAASGINKLINSLSSSNTVKPATVVFADKGIYRIDLRDYDWTAETWEKMIRVYPYLIVPKDTKGLGNLQKDTGTTVPVVRTDWFLATASRAPIYYDLLDFPGTLAEFEKKFGVNSVQNIAGGKAVRAGFNNSGVSKENRIIERIEGSDGPFWRSYEFGTSLTDQNIFERPLGPIVAGRQAATTFREDGGEFIVTLKNGMLGFYIAGRNKKRLSSVPTEPEEDEIIAGASCMACHKKGYIHRGDMVNDKVKENAQLASIAAEVEQLYIPSEKLKKLVEEDSESYRSTLKKAGVDLENGEPVNRIARGYELAIPLAQVAAEAGATEEELISALENSPALSELAEWFNDGKINRVDFNEFFKLLSEGFNK